MKWPPRDDWTCRSLFLDSGAHSVYSEHVLKKKHQGRDRYSYYRTPAFWEYVDRYAEFVKKNKEGLDYYVSVDVIFNPEMTWEVQKYLEDKHGLNPIPVIHYGAPLKWVDKYLAKGYEYLGIGGLGQEAKRGAYLHWADQVFQRLCPKPSCLPLVRTHGFAMTSYRLMIRYPWFSVDSSSWVKAAAYGKVYVPHKRGGRFTFAVEPYQVSFSWDSLGSRSERGRGDHYEQLSKDTKAIVREWLDQIGVPLGESAPNGESEDVGVCNDHKVRGLANLLFFEAMCARLPEWPWPFKSRPRTSLF